MKFLLDHDVPDDVASLLQHWGHAVILLRSALEIRAPDEAIYRYMCEQRLILITCNRNHFLKLAGTSMDHPGLIILIRRRTRQMECARLYTLLNSATESGIAGNINFA